MRKIGELVKIKQVDGFKIQERTLTPEKNRGEGLGTHKINLVTGSTTFQNPRAKYEVCVSTDEAIVLMRKADGRKIKSIKRTETATGFTLSVEVE